MIEVILAEKGNQIGCQRPERTPFLYEEATVLSSNDKTSIRPNTYHINWGVRKFFSAQSLPKFPTFQMEQALVSIANVEILTRDKRCVEFAF